jgi:hypothetical protein
MLTWFDVKVFEDVEDVDEDGAAGRRSDAVQDLVAEIDGNWTLPDRSKKCQITI